MSDVIEAALQAHADNGGSSMDALGNSVMVAEAPVEEAPAAPVEASPEAAPAEGAVEPAVPADTPQGAAAAAQDEIDKLLEAEGIKAPQVGIRENRIPYSRTKTIIANAQRKWEADFKAKTEPELQTYQQRLQQYTAQEQLAANDPDRFIAALAAVDPRYAKFLQQQGAAEPAKQAAKDDDPEPQPDKDPATGQLYYTPEKWAEVQAWTRRQAVREAEKAVDAKYGTVLTRLQQQEAAQAEYARRQPVVEAQIKRLNDTYGAELVKKHESDIVKVMQEHAARNEHLTAAEAAAIVLTPKLKVDEAALRAKLLAEINGRPAAAQRYVAAQSKDVTPAAELSGEALIKAELDKVMPNRNR